MVFKVNPKDQRQGGGHHSCVLPKGAPIARHSITKLERTVIIRSKVKLRDLIRQADFRGGAEIR
jgi:hypothetical protein